MAVVIGNAGLGGPETCRPVLESDVADVAVTDKIAAAGLPENADPLVKDSSAMAARRKQKWSIKSFDYSCRLSKNDPVSKRVSGSIKLDTADNLLARDGSNGPRGTVAAHLEP